MDNGVYNPGWIPGAFPDADINGAYKLPWMSRHGPGQPGTTPTLQAFSCPGRTIAEANTSRPGSTHAEANTSRPGRIGTVICTMAADAAAMPRVKLSRGGV